MPFRFSTAASTVPDMGLPLQNPAPSQRMLPPASGRLDRWAVFMSMLGIGSLATGSAGRLHCESGVIVSPDLDFVNAS